MNDSARRAETGAFLKARRAAISPGSVGICAGDRRRTPGLRREELASLAGVGLTWYTWLEQGRDINPSAAMLGRVSKALRLGAADEAYLLSLVGTRRRLSPAPGVELNFAERQVMQMHPGVAFALSGMFDVVAYNAPADRLYDLANPVGPFEKNQLWQVFMNPRRRALYTDFASAARNFVALFRLNAVTQVGEPYFGSLVSALAEGSPEFRTLWQEQRAAPMAPITVDLQHPTMGRLRLSSVRFPLQVAPGAMMVFLVPEDAASSAALTPGVPWTKPRAWTSTSCTFARRARWRTLRRSSWSAADSQPGS